MYRALLSPEAPANSFPRPRGAVRERSFRIHCGLRLVGLLITSGLLFVAAEAETLKIATYNVENYVTADRMTDAGFRKAYPKPESEKHALRQVILRLDADILAIQEMGPRPYLDELLRDLKREGLDYPYAVLLDGPDTERHVAVLSKRTLQATSHEALSFSYFGSQEKVKRGLLELRLMTSAGELTLFAVHLKSRYTDRPDDPESALRREGEAAVVQAAIEKAIPSREGRFLVLGDFNDDRASRTVQRLLKHGNRRVAVLLPAVDSRGETWTHHYHKEDRYSRLDHILVSPALMPSVRGGVGDIEDGVGTLDASDHRPLVVTLDFPEKKAGPKTGLEKETSEKINVP